LSKLNKNRGNTSKKLCYLQLPFMFNLQLHVDRYAQTYPIPKGYHIKIGNTCIDDIKKYQEVAPYHRTT